MRRVVPLCDLTEFFTRGHIFGDCLTSDDVAFLSAFDFVDSSQNNLSDDSTKPPTAMIPLLNQIRLELEKTLLTPMFEKFIFLQQAIWAGADEDSLLWHNDNTGEDSLNSSILLYLDDHTQESHLRIRSKDDEHIVMVKSGQFVWMNQQKDFQHKVVYTDPKVKRRIVSFEYLLNF